MHCRFEDVESGRLLEMDFSLDQEGSISESDVKEETKDLEPYKVE